MPHFFSERVGGVEVQTFLIAKYLALLLWKVDFIAETADSEKVGTSEIIEGIHVHWIRQRGLFSFFRRDITQHLKRLNPAIIYQRGRNRFTSSPYVYYYSKKRRAKLVYHCAENNDLELHFNVIEVMRSQNNVLKKSVLYLHAKLADHFFRRTVSLSDLIIVQNGVQRTGFDKIYSRKSSLLNSSHETPPAPFIKESPPVVLWIAHAGRRKRLELFVDLAKRLHDESAQFIFAGTIPHEDYRSEIFAQLEGMNNIKYLGPLSWSESNALFAKASVFVNTTQQDREGFPNTYLQAWFHEVPVITLDCDPDGIIVKNGLGFHSGSPDQMAQDIKTLLNNKSLREAMGKKARTYAIQHHDIIKTAEQLNILLTATINSGT